MNKIFIYNSRKVFFVALTTSLVLGSFFVAGSVSASATINSAKLNGLSDIVVEGSAIITATVDVSLTNQSVWKSTAYRFGNGNWICVNTPDHNTTAKETFSITAPAKAGTSKVYFEVYGNDDCTDNVWGIVALPASILTPVASIFSFAVHNIYQINLLVVLVFLIIAFVSLYSLKKTR